MDHDTDWLTPSMFKNRKFLTGPGPEALGYSAHSTTQSIVGFHEKFYITGPLLEKVTSSGKIFPFKINRERGNIREK